MPLSDILYVYKNQIKNRLLWLIYAIFIGHDSSPFPRKRNVTSLSLLYRYLHGKCPDELHSFIQTFSVWKRHVTSMDLNHPHSLRIPFVNRNSTHTASFQEPPLTRGFTTILIDSRINHYISSTTSKTYFLLFQESSTLSNSCAFY